MTSQTGPGDSEGSSGQWVFACLQDEVEREDLLGVLHGMCTIALCRLADGQFHAVDGICSHERAPLTDGFVRGETIECPKHNGRFNIRTGQAVRLPARKALATFPVKVEDGKVYVWIGPVAP
jgi:3-phenylpropionate/trans-cinnamate dioxygenase ferredoxin subunit